MLGKVKFFSDSKGFGFITSEDKADYFVHHSEIQMQGHRSLTEGQPVEFTPAEDPKGRKALKVFPK